MSILRLEQDRRGSYAFSFTSPRGEVSGRVNVGTEGPPDKRSTGDKERAALRALVGKQGSMKPARIRVRGRKRIEAILTICWFGKSLRETTRAHRSFA
jgi:hypothetical protein